jgi:hypothetical protein
MRAGVVFGLIIVDASLVCMCVCVCVLRGLRRISKYGYSTPHKTESNHLAVDTMHVSVSERIGMYGGSRGK